MSVITQYIVSKVKEGATETLSYFFANVEEVLNSCDACVEKLIVVGLFEGIQNAAGNRINYYSDFNQWLQPKSRLNWDALIDSWEGNEWRTIKK